MSIKTNLQERFVQEQKDFREQINTFAGADHGQKASGTTPVPPPRPFPGR